MYESDHRIERLNVLAVDDNEADLVLLRRALSKVRRYSIAFDGVMTLEEARGRLREGAVYDVVFMDYRLGDVDGIEAIRLLRDSGQLIPLILLTGQGSETLAARSRRVGASDYLSKETLDPTVLQESLEFVISDYRRQRRDSRALKDALVDGLTGLFVKDYLSRRAREEFNRAGRYETALSIVMLDLDHFKALNDNHGHLAGDEVLRRCAEVIRAGIRETDIAGRFGGEEFCVVLPQCGLEGAVALAERIRAGIEEISLEYAGKKLRVTVSAGAAELQPGSTDVNELIDAADRALYRAKRGGRNRVAADEIATSQVSMPS